MTASRSSLMDSYTKLDDQLSEQQLIPIIEAAVPTHAHMPGPRSWTWTTPTGLWHINLGYSEDNPSVLKARLDGSPSWLQVCVRTTRREVNAALHWLVLVGAIDHHPDADQTEARDA